MSLFATLVSESKQSINDLLDYCILYCGFAKNSVRIQFHLGDCGLTDQGSSLYTYQGHLLRTATSRVVYVKDSIFAWSAEEDCV
jgi:hypothetical protein